MSTESTTSVFGSVLDDSLLVLEVVRRVTAGRRASPSRRARRGAPLLMLSAVIPSASASSYQRDLALAGREHE